LIDEMRLWMLGGHKGTYSNKVSLNLSPFKSSTIPCPFSLKRKQNINVLFTTKVIVEDIALGMCKTSFATIFSISLNGSMHLPS